MLLNMMYPSIHALGKNEGTLAKTAAIDKNKEVHPNLREIMAKKLIYILIKFNCRPHTHVGKKGKGDA